MVEPMPSLVLHTADEITLQLRASLSAKVGLDHDLDLSLFSYSRLIHSHLSRVYGFGSSFILWDEDESHNPSRDCRVTTAHVVDVHS
jgi:hypothetical protein